MMQSEFEAMTHVAIQHEDYAKTIEYIYMYSAEYPEKEDVARFFLDYGLNRMEDYAEYMRATEVIWTNLPNGVFPGVEAMKKLVEKALEPEPEETPVDIWDWEFRTFLRDISRILQDAPPDIIRNVTTNALQMYKDKTLVTMTKIFAQKHLDQIEDRCWDMQSFLGDNNPIAALVDYNSIYINTLRELGYEI